MTQTTQSNTTPSGNTRASIRSRRWSLTLNNYTEEEYETITQKFNEKEILYIIGKEVGKENGTPHLQMYIETKNPMALSTLKKINDRMHIEKARGNKKANLKYCMKENDFITTFNIEEKKSLEDKLLEYEYKDVEWKDWQQDIINIINQPVDKRKVHWVWEETGNVGKSFLCKYIALKYNAIIASGKTNDIFNQVLNWRNAMPNEAQIPPVIIDVPRSEFSHINYAAIEQLKNGFLYCGKYEGGKVYGLSPHVIVFANSPPNFSQLSEDRFNELNIQDQSSS